jgi:hypothetical protein
LILIGNDKKAENALANKKENLEKHKTEGKIDVTLIAK